MDYSEKKIQDLCNELSQIRDLCGSAAAKLWSEDDWMEAKITAKEIVAEIKLVAKKRISELESERELLVKQYPKFSKRFLYKIIGVPEKVIAAEKRYNEINLEIEKYQKYLK